MIRQHLEIAKGQDFSIGFRCTDRLQVKSIAQHNSGATSLNAAPIREAMLSGDKLLFGENLVVALSAGANAQAILLTVTAIGSPIRPNDIGKKITNLTDYDLSFKFYSDETSEDAIFEGDISKDDATNGHAVLSGNCDLDRGTYYWRVNRDNTDDVRPLAHGDVLIW